LVAWFSVLALLMAKTTVTAVVGNDEASGQKTVNQYRLGDEVGRGAYSIVRWAEDGDGVGYAVKVFSRGVLERKHVAHFDCDGASTISLKVKIEGELRTLRSLCHVSIAPLLEVIDDPVHDKLYAVFEGMQGGQLMHWSTERLQSPAPASPTSDESDDGGGHDRIYAYTISSIQAKVQSKWADRVRCGESEADRASAEVTVFQEAVAKVLFRQIVEAVVYMHEQGVIHKDLKPDNIMNTLPTPSADGRFARLLALKGWPSLTPPRQVGPLLEANGSVQSDAGIAAFLEASGFRAKIGDFNTAATCEQPECLIYDAEGTPQFTPPECFVGASGGVRGKPRDAWSLGCVLFTMLFGRLPFWATENLTVQLMIMQDDLVIPSGIASPQAEEVITGLLHKDPAMRMTQQAVLQSAWLAG